MPTQAYALFNTPIGHCGIAWSERGVTGVQLPEQDEAATRARMGRRFPKCSDGVAPPQVQEAICAVVALLSGAPAAPLDLSNVVLDMDGVPPFHLRVYALARRLLPGETVTYGEMARELGDPGAARAVGQALGSNPFAPVVPCHRVLAADGRAGGFSANGGVTTKLRLLLIERARFNGPGLFDDAVDAPLPCDNSFRTS
ncbi:methylated-DNA--[protein]-cysteine S-methyltransferase [Rhodoferax sp.]|uniref:methylated-DNA--[protein]-cysteine S-methyltransferase n=1 Tax=Rhodoferax sp. TaxID=50421 RepID=UPI00271C8809|nr:methylated-DNA--[protein]-cysteine S-methyltransferase [Rhodoferax sp.]MDO9199232.1 methylated-DNA--[protein]-cysteine S-methyltransferase [Rhodoferax sp.]